MVCMCVYMLQYIPQIYIGDYDGVCVYMLQYLTQVYGGDI